MVENRDAITRWRDGLGEIAGLAALALRENWRNTDRFVVARIMPPSQRPTSLRCSSKLTTFDRTLVVKWQLAAFCYYKAGGSSIW
jgi:hypothetical protein